MFSLLPVGVAVSYDPECRDMRANPSFARTLRVRPDENVSMSRADPDRLPFRPMRHGRQIPAQDLPMQLSARTGRLVVGSEFDLVFGDGDAVHVYASAAPLLDGRAARCAGRSVRSRTYRRG